MRKVSLSKQLAIVKEYLAGFSYDEIVFRAGVSKGTVANIVSGLRAGRFPETSNLSDQVELLRELAIGLKHAQLTPGQAVAGLAVLSHLQTLGVEPADIGRWAAMCRELAPQETEAQAFVKVALALEQARERTGLSLEALEEKARSLEETAARLEPTVTELQGHQTQLWELGKRREGLSREIDGLEKRREPLRQAVAQNEERDRELTSRVHDLEQRAQAADERLAVARRDLKALAGLGLSLEDLSGFVQRLAGVAQRHGIGPAALRDRLLHELEALEECLGLEALVEMKHREATEAEQGGVKAREEQAALQAANEKLRQEQARLHAAMVTERKHVSKEVQAIAAVIKDGATELRRELGSGVGEALAEVQRLRDQSLELGREMGRFEAVVQANEWLEGLLSLTGGDGDIQAHQVRTLGLAALRGTLVWLERHPEEVPLFTLKTRVASLVSELEQWRL